MPKLKEGRADTRRDPRRLNGSLAAPLYLSDPSLPSSDYDLSKVLDVQDITENPFCPVHKGTLTTRGPSGDIHGKRDDYETAQWGRPTGVVFQGQMLSLFKREDPGSMHLRLEKVRGHESDSNLDCGGSHGDSEERGDDDYRIGQEEEEGMQDDRREIGDGPGADRELNGGLSLSQETGDIAKESSASHCTSSHKNTNNLQSDTIYSPSPHDSDDNIIFRSMRGPKPDMMEGDVKGRGGSAEDVGVKDDSTNDENIASCEKMMPRKLLSGRPLHGGVALKDGNPTSEKLSQEEAEMKQRLLRLAHYDGMMEDEKFAYNAKWPECTQRLSQPQACEVIKIFDKEAEVGGCLLADVIGTGKTRISIAKIEGKKHFTTQLLHWRDHKESVWSIPSPGSVIQFGIRSTSCAFVPEAPPTRERLPVFGILAITTPSKALGQWESTYGDMIESSRSDFYVQHESSTQRLRDIQRICGKYKQRQKQMPKAAQF
ncbi:uncharacterized protein Z520_11726 [Fonsecaea multimorphosa CBS 102226]|uniref:Uncharacterized protein n=1 Tax=Fonsecaea multimorphosa CBS 102226 TaxID=1442371 RepID=A0A0D2GSU9_9EURO|nr:uncharacterized protein Z520_11726 [Fonsecaea multimorphosa CBS 102226]KIX92550.1 hypothetical protein Z520_11726 [Fonsecaea multimorphosa CBS 102226]OAL17818.1 hypothetical protein AYO22_11245 [Fonsecaea multimorphosa]